MLQYKIRQVSAGVDLVTWDNLKDGDEAQAYDKFGTHATVEVSGDAAGVDILGSIRGDESFLLHDLDLSPLSFSRPGIKSCTDSFIGIKPKKTGPGEATVAMIIRRS